jgi:hypothetical protein
MKFLSCASQSFLISSHASCNALQLFTGPHAILGDTVLVPIIKQMGDLRRGHDAMRADVSHLMISCDFPPLEFYFGMSLRLLRFASGP